MLTWWMGVGLMLAGVVLMAVAAWFRKPGASFWVSYTMLSAHRDLRAPGPLLAWLGYGCILASLITMSVASGQ